MIIKYTKLRLAERLFFMAEVLRDFTEKSNLTSPMWRYKDIEIGKQMNKESSY